MLNVVTEQFLRSHIRKILHEGDEDDKKPPAKKEKKLSRRAAGNFIIKSSVPGSPPKGMRLADPKAVMQNLKAEGSYAGQDPIKVLQSLLSKAISGTESMGKAYGTVKDVKDSYGREGVSVAMGELDANNGARFMKITLSAAKDAGMLQLDEDIRVEVGGNGVVIYKSKGGNASWEKPMKQKKKKQ